MSALSKLETQLDEVLNKKAPVKLPADARKGLAGAMWWIALAVGVLQLWAVWSLWHLGHWVDQAVTYSNYISATYGYGVPTPHLNLFYWLSLLTLGVDAVLLLVAAPQLKQMHKSGWDLLFYSALLNAVAALVGLFSNIGGGFGSLIGAVVGSVIGAWLLFQVRDYFGGAKKAEHAAPASHSDKK